MKEGFCSFLFALLFSCLLAAADLPEWRFPAERAKWGQLRRLTVQAEEDCIFLGLLERDSGLGIQGLSLDAAEIGGFTVEYRAEGFAEGTTGQLYYASAEEPSFSAERCLNVPSLNTDGAWHTVKILTDSLWRAQGKVTALRLDLVDQFPGKLWLRHIAAFPVETTRAEERGIPEEVPVELGTTEASWKLHISDPCSERFASPMAAPATGGFDFTGISYLRKEFVLSKPVRRALLATVVDDVMKSAWLNGGQISREAWSYYWKRPDFIELDPDDFRVGKNVLCLEYRNGGGLGGVMADLQIVDEDGGYHLVTLEGAKGFFRSEPAGNWMQVEASCDWPKVETRDGAPSKPWTFTPEYRSIDPNRPQVEVLEVHWTDDGCLVNFRCTPEVKGDEVFFARILNNDDWIIWYGSGTLDEMSATKAPNGELQVYFDTRYAGLRYGMPTRVHWQFGVYGRNASGAAADIFQELGERPLPGEPVSLRLEQTEAGARPMLNGEPFYFISMNVEHLDVPTGMEGVGSPCNIITTRAGGFAPKPWWIGVDEYDFTVVDRQLSFCAECYPDAWLGLYIWCHPGQWYAKMFPERLAKQDDGNLVEPRLGNGCPVSFSNEDYRADAERAVCALVAHCEKYFGSRIVFYNLQGGITYEWQGWNSHTRFLGDYAEEAAKDFQRYALKHGVEVSGVPSRAEREAGLPGGLLRDPVHDAVSILYERFYSESISECIDRFARVVREETHGDKLIGTYYGYHQEFASLGYCVNGGGHNDLHRLLKSPNLDFFLSPIDYRHRSIGGPSSDMKPYGAIWAAGKLALSEDDTRTNLIAPTIFDQTLNLEQTLAVLKRNHGLALTRGQHLNHLPLVGGTELASPAIWELFQRSLAAGQRMLEGKQVSPKAEVAVVLDEEALALFVPTLKQISVPDVTRYHYDPATGKLVDVNRGVQPITGELLGDQQLALSQCGMAVDWLMLQEPQTLAGYKLVIFAGTLQDTPQLHEALRVVRENDATALFLYGTGFMTTNGVDVDRMSELLDIQCCELPRGDLRVSFTDGREAGVEYPVQPRFGVVDAAAEPLAKYVMDGAIAAARKGKSIFYGGVAPDAQFLREVAREAGVHIYMESDDNFFAGGDFLCIHTDSAGEKTIRLPRRTDAVEIYTGEVLGRDTDCLSFPLRAFETRVICLGKADEILEELGFANTEK